MPHNPKLSKWSLQIRPPHQTPYTQLVSFMPYAQPPSVIWLPKYLVSTEHKAYLYVVIFTPLVVTVTN
jgi:hypothetical protein